MASKVAAMVKVEGTDAGGWKLLGTENVKNCFQMFDFLQYSVSLIFHTKLIQDIGHNISKSAKKSFRKPNKIFHNFQTNPSKIPESIPGKNFFRFSE